MHRRVLSPNLYAPLPSLREILLADSGVDISEASEQSSRGWQELIKGVLAVEVLAWSSLILLIPLSRGVPERLSAAVASSKFIGLGAFTFFLCLAAVVTKTPLSASFASGVVAVFAVVALVVEVQRRFSGVASLFRTTVVLRHVQVIQCLFLGISALFFFVQAFVVHARVGVAFDPALLAFFTRNETFPPQDPALAGQRLPFFDYGPFSLPLVFGLLFKVLGTTPNIQYPVAVAITAGILASVFYATISFVLRKQETAFLLTSLVALGSAVVWSRLNGDLCLETSCSSERASATSAEATKIASWFERSIKGTPTIFDAGKLSQLPVSSVALAAGIPVFLARDMSSSNSEVVQQEIERRRAAIKEVYNSKDAEAAFKILQNYGVDLVLVGPTERSLFSNEALSKFEHHEDYFSERYSVGEWRVFATAFSPYFILPGAGILGEDRR
jgi:uncharacterized membrane protein